jgi:hypothetical protein
MYDVSTMSLIVKHADEERRPCEITNICGYVRFWWVCATRFHEYGNQEGPYSSSLDSCQFLPHLLDDELLYTYSMHRAIDRVDKKGMQFLWMPVSGRTTQYPSCKFPPVY